MNKLTLQLWMATAPISIEDKCTLIDDFKNIENLLRYVWDHRNESKVIYKLFENYDENKLITLENYIINEGIRFVDFTDELYPENLLNISCKPYGLFYKGDIKKLNKNINVAIVGSRKSTTYGDNVAAIIAKDLASKNINIISGMARGIDSVAHVNALKENGFTAAVLGCGVDKAYPSENKKLYEEIIKSGGVIVSEFSPGTEPFSRNFPIRNRIISGVSEIVIVVEAGEKSGSLITASRAIEQGREVLVVPGSIFSNESKGANKLILDGAAPFTKLEDVYNLLHLGYNKKIKNTESLKVGNEFMGLYDIINENPIHLNDIIRLSNIDIKRLYELLFEMQLREDILCLSGNYYVRINKKI